MSRHLPPVPVSAPLPSVELWDEYPDYLRDSDIVFDEHYNEKAMNEFRAIVNPEDPRIKFAKLKKLTTG
jgi:hypothetical protein